MAEARRAVIRIQAGARGMAQRRDNRERDAAAVLAQAAFRGHKARAQVSSGCNSASWPMLANHS